MPSLTAGEIVWKINGDNSGFDRSIQKSEKTAKGFGGFLSKMKIGVAAVGAGLLVMGKSALKNASALEQNEIALTTMLKSSAKAKQVLKEFREFGAATPFETTEIIKSGKQLIAFGVSADNVTDTLKRIGDVAAGIGAPLGDLAEIYGKIKVSQTVYNEDLNQLAGRGIPIFEELAKVTGKSATEIKKMSSEGKIGFKEIEQSFKNMSGAGGKFEGMMKAQSQSLGGLWSTLQSQLTEVSTEMGEKMAPASKELVQAFSRLTEEGGGLKQALMLVAKGLGAVIQGAADVVNWFGDMGDAMSLRASETHVNELSKGVENYGKKLEKAGVIKKGLVSLNGELTAAEEEIIRSAVKSSNNLRLQKEFSQDINKLAIERESLQKKLNSQLSMTNHIRNMGKNILDMIKKEEKIAASERKAKRKANRDSRRAEYKRRLAAAKSFIKSTSMLNKTAEEKILQNKKDNLAKVDKFVKQKVMNEKQAADARVEIEKNADDKIFENRLAMANDMGSRIGGVFSAIQSLQTAMMESQLGKLDEQMEAEMVAAGVAEETTQAKIEREIAAAESVGDAETAAEKKKELARTKIQEKYAKKRAEIEYNVALMQWKFNLATAIATAPLTVLNALTAGMKFSPIVAGIYAGLASAAAGIQIGAVAASRPAPPSFQTGGIVSGGQSAGDNMSAQVNSGEMILNGLQQRRLFDMADGRGSNNNMKQVSVSEESTWSEIFNASKNGNLFIDTRAVVST